MENYSLSDLVNDVPKPYTVKKYKHTWTFGTVYHIMYEDIVIRESNENKEKVQHFVDALNSAYFVGAADLLGRLDLLILKGNNDGNS